jgi:hypothetical protein
VRVLVLVTILLTSTKWSGADSLVWDAPTTRADGSPLLNLSHYTVSKNDEVVASSSSTTCLIPPVSDPAKYYVRAVDDDGLVSSPSNSLFLLECPIVPTNNEELEARVKELEAERDFWKREVITAKALKDAASRRETECIRERLKCCK